MVSEESMKFCSDQKDGVIGCRVGQGAGSIEQSMDKVVKVVDCVVHLSIWLFVPLKSISVKYKCRELWKPLDCWSKLVNCEETPY